MTREAQSPVRFTIGQLPVAVQLSTSSRDRAIALARGFAQKQAVDVWYAEDRAVRLLEIYRTRASSRVEVKTS